MKVTDLRRKLIAALVAGGTLAPGALRAADLNSNIVVNGGFESVDPMIISNNYGSVKILDWDDGSRVGFAYSHDGSMNGFGTVIPDYANGTLANGGHFYFAPASTPGWPNVAREVSQIIDVSDGASGILIPTGAIGYVLQADFSGYLAQPDSSQVYVEFLNSSGAHIGAASVNNLGETTTWTHKTASGGVPAGTKTIHVSLIRQDPQVSAPDGYVDNVDIQLTASVPQLVLLVDRNTGNIELNNLTGDFENISGYSITSAFGALKPASWLSIAENYDSGNAGPNQVDASNPWDELTKSSSRGDLSEGDFFSGTGADLADERVVNLGNAWITTPVEDLVFQYVSDGVVVTGVVGYVGNGNNSLPLGDLNANGTINSTDWAVFRANQHADMTGLSLAEAYKLGDLNRDLQNDHADFILFKEVFEVTNGAGSFAAMLSAIPEPTTALLVLAGGLFVVPVAGRSARRR